MTITHAPHPRPVPAASKQRPLRGRLIGVGVRDYLHDQAGIEWSAADAVAGLDVLHIVHAYIPLQLDSSVWEPVVRARDVRYLTARRVVAQAMQRARPARTALAVDGSAIAGLPEDVLLELSNVVDLIVMGDDAGAPEGIRKISWRVQDRAHCPVVCVPAGARRIPDRPVTVIADERGPSAAAMAFGSEAALRHGVGLRVARIEHDLDWLPRERQVSSLLVASTSAAALLRSCPADPTAAVPVAVVPER